MATKKAQKTAKKVSKPAAKGGKVTKGKKGSKKMGTGGSDRPS